MNLVQPPENTCMASARGKSNFHLSGTYRMIKNFPPCHGINSSKVPLFAHSFVSSLFLLSKKGELYYHTNESITGRQILWRLLLISKSYEVAEVPQKLTYSPNSFQTRHAELTPGQSLSRRWQEMRTGQGRKGLKMSKSVAICVQLRVMGGHSGKFPSASEPS